MTPREEVAVRLARLGKPGRSCRIYNAEALAGALHPLPALTGDLQGAAQSYADRITRSAWWRRNAACWTHPTEPPRRVLVEYTKRGGVGFAHAGMFKRRGRWYPLIRIGHGPGDSGLPAIRDPWVLLHELAHIAAPPDEHHGAEFARIYLGLVRRFAGREAAAYLQAAYKACGVRYRRRAVSQVAA